MAKTLEEIKVCRDELQKNITDQIRKFINECGGDDLIRIEAECEYIQGYSENKIRFSQLNIIVKIPAIL